MAVQLGDTFLLGKGSHLWIVISDPAKHNGEFVIVNVTSDEFRAGKECELNVGDHQWVRHRSYVSFGDARRVTPAEEAKIQLYISQGNMKQPSPTDVRLRASLSYLISKDLPLCHKERESQQ